MIIIIIITDIITVQPPCVTTSCKQPLVSKTPEFSQSKPYT